MTAEEYVRVVRTEIARLSQHTDGRLGQAMTRMLAQHTEFGIYDECEHEHRQIGWNGPWPVYEPGVADVDEIGPTCNHVYSVCSQCCTDQLHGSDPVQREDCADACHDPFWHSCWPCQAWLDAGDALGLSRPDEAGSAQRPRSEMTA